MIREVDIADSIGCLRYYAGWADKIVGQVSQYRRRFLLVCLFGSPPQTIEVDNRTKLALTRHDPIGVVGQM